MRRCAVQRLPHIGLRLRERLARQREHQVEIEVVEAALRNLDRLQCLSAIVDATERSQFRLIEGLDADRQTIDARVAIGPEALRVEGARIGLQRDFAVDLERQQRPHIRQKLFQPACAEQPALSRLGVPPPMNTLRMRRPQISGKAASRSARTARRYAASGTAATPPSGSCELKSQYGHLRTHQGK